MNLEEINLTLVLVLFSCFMIGWYAREWYAVRVLKRLLANVGASENTATEMIPIYITKSGDTFNVFNSNDDKFITNVQSKDEMVEYFKRNHPNATVVMNKQNSKVFE